MQRAGRVVIGLCVSVSGLSAFAVACMTTAEWWSPPAPGVDEFYDLLGRPSLSHNDNVVLKGRLVASVAAAGVALAVQVALMCSDRWLKRFEARAMVLASVFALPAVLVGLPEEDPYTGAGAGPLRIIFAGMACVVVAAVFLPPAWLLVMTPARSERPNGSSCE